MICQTRALIGPDLHPWRRAGIARRALDLASFENYEVLDQLVGQDPNLDRTPKFLPVPGGPFNGYHAIRVIQAINAESAQPESNYTVFANIEMAMTLSTDGHLALIQRLRREFFPRLKRAELYERWV